MPALAAGAPFTLGDLWLLGSGMGNGWTACPGNESLGEEPPPFRGWIYSIQPPGDVLVLGHFISVLSPFFFFFLRSGDVKKGIRSYIVRTRKWKWVFVLVQGTCTQKSVHICVGERERGRQKASQALRYFINLGHSSLDVILNKKTK